MKKISVVVGQQFGSRTVLELTPAPRGKSIQWCRWRCEKCGSEGDSSVSHLNARRSKHCRNCSRFPNGFYRVGQRLGKLQILQIEIGSAIGVKSENLYCLVQCDCGGTPTWIPATILRKKGWQECKSCRYPYWIKVGDIFGTRKVVEIISRSRNFVRLECMICGAKASCTGTYLKRDLYPCKNCLDRHENWDNVVGQIFGLRTVVRIGYKPQNGAKGDSERRICWTRCICGAEAEVNYSHLRQGVATACRDCGAVLQYYQRIYPFLNDDDLREILTKSIEVRQFLKEQEIDNVEEARIKASIHHKEARNARFAGGDSTTVTRSLLLERTDDPSRTGGIRRGETRSQ